MSSRKNLASAIAVLSITGFMVGCDTPETTTLDGGTDSEISIIEDDMMDHGAMDHDMMGHGAMNLGPADGEYNLRFIDAMIPHHEGAIAMAEEALENSDREEITTLANTIIEAQEEEIAQMQQWRSDWYPDAPETPTAWDSVSQTTTSMTPEQMAMMRMDMELGSGDDEFDLRFINAMIPHHQAAVTMAEDSITKSENPEMQELAQNIIVSQQEEINQLEQWRQEWYGF